MRRKMEQTLILVKPDGVQRGLVGEIIARFENKGLRLSGLKLMQVTKELAEQHYDCHKGKPFYDGLVKFITSSPVVAMVWTGDDAINLCRTVMGATRPSEAQPGTIRGDFAINTGHNLVHGSDSPENASREIGLFFKPQEVVDYERLLEKWFYEGR